MSIVSKLGLRKRELDLLTGNAMHLTSQGAWMIYVLSNTTRRDWSLVVPPKMPSDEESDEEKESSPS